MRPSCAADAGRTLLADRGRRGAVRWAQQLDLTHGGPIAHHRERRDRVAAGASRRSSRAATPRRCGSNVTVTADRLIALYRPKERRAPRRNRRSAADRRHADTGGNEIYRVQAEGNVHIFTPTDQAQGDRAIYDLDQAVLVMTGRAEADHAERHADRARQPGILVAEAHGGGARRRRGGDQRRRRIAADTLVAYTTAGTPQPQRRNAGWPPNRRRPVR